MRTGAQPVPLLRDGRYVRIWLVGWFTGIVRWLELLAYGIYAYDLTGSPVLVASIALARFIPMAALSLFIGAAADQLSARGLLAAGLAASLLVSAAMVAVAASGHLAYWMLVLATLASGVFWASDMPLRRKMIGEIAGPDRLARAMAIDYATSNGTRMLGPLLGGVVYQSVGMTGVFTMSTVLYAAALGLSLAIGRTGGRRGGRFQPGAVASGSWRALRKALRNNDVRNILAVTVVFNVWGFPFVAMIPVIGAQSLGLSPSMIGYVSAVEGATALIGLALVAWLVRPAWFRRLYAIGAACHLVSVAAIGLAPGLGGFAVGIAAAGFAAAGFSSMQATLIYRAAPPGMRGRYLGLLSICIGAGLVGLANVGLMAELIGARAALVVMAAEGAVALALVATNWRALHEEAGIAAPGSGGPAPRPP